MNLLDLHYAEWMMIAGGILVVIGFFGFALNQKKNLPPEGPEPDDQGLGNVPRRVEIRSAGVAV